VTKGKGLFSVNEGLRFVSMRLRPVLLEYLKFDSVLARKGLGLAASVLASAARAFGRDDIWFRLRALVFNGNLLPSVDAQAARVCGELLRNDGWLNSACVQHVKELAATPATQAFFDDPERIIGGRTVVVKKRQGLERGVIVVDYNFAFPTLAHFFDLQRIAKHYYLVMVPSWTGLMVKDVLSFATLEQPIICLASEEKDFQFIKGLGSQLVPVRASANFFCDHRTFYPVPSSPRDIDVLSVAAWGEYKRHAKLFRALREVKRRRGHLKAVMVGYPADLTMKELKFYARHYGLADDIEFHEWISPEEVNALYSRTKVNVLWSRREGSGRSPIEGMLAGAPCVLRSGFNYGESYEHINPATGCFSTEAGLPDTLISYLDADLKMDPRSWVLKNMTPQIVTARIADELRRLAEQNSEPWTEGLVEICGYLNGQIYWDPADKLKFEGDYEFLRSCLRPNPNN
jgi:glycosyltransferase involved in cell wall biosynthesis